MLDAADPLPPFADPEEAYQRAGAVLLPRKRMRVAEAAERYRVITSGGQVGYWRNATAPYMVEPMDCTASREYEAVVFAGPARSSKTAAMVLNRLLHAVVCDPADTLLLHMTESDARLFSMQHVAPMNQACPEMGRRLSPARSDDNLFDKRYQGMLLVIGWPTATQLAAKDYELVLLTDYDRMPESVGGEGSPFDLARKRTQTYGSRGMTVVESSPGREVTDAAWLAVDPHEAPPTTGILDLYNRGDRRLRYWPCPHCGEYFEGRFALFDWPKEADGSPRGGIEEAVAKVVMLCPECGAAIDERHKPAMNAAGVWLRQGQRIDGCGNVSGPPRKSRIASFWLKGPAAAFQSWSSLVRNHLTAWEAYQRTGQTEALKTTVNVDQGEAFLPPKARAGEGVDPDVLVARVEPGWRLGTVPAGVRALVVTVDVQGTWFDVQVTGYGPGFEAWVVDRFAISDSAEPGRMLQPGSYAEDWQPLFGLLDRAWPLADDPARAMRPLVLAVDSGGVPGVTGNAYRFAGEARRRGISGQRLMLVKGDAKVGPKRVAQTKVDYTVKGRVLISGLKLWLVGTDDLKDDVAAALARESAGEGYLHAPADLPRDWFAQLAAERRTDKGKWEKVSDRNEAWDHLVYGRAALLRPPYRWDRSIDWTNPPAWALPAAGNALTAAGEATPPRAVKPSPQPSTPPATGGVSVSARRGDWIGRRDGWLKR